MNERTHVCSRDYKTTGMDIYASLTKKKYLLFFCLVGFCVISFVFDIMTGAAMIPVSDVISCLFNAKDAVQTTQVIVWTMRLPIAIMALLIGFSLGLSGAVMQTILHNPLASPYTLGVGAGAALGASLSIIMGWGQIGVSVCSFVFAISICLLIYFMGNMQDMSTGSMVLSGIAILFLFQALQALLQYGASETQNQSIVFWTFGSLQKATWSNIGIVALVILVCVPFIMRDSWKYTALLMGDKKAQSLGINIKRLKLKAFIIISLLSAAAVCFTGTIGFIGLAGPHIARMIVGGDQRFYIPVSAACGMAVLSCSSIVSKVIAPGTIYPIGIITSIIGVPFFFMLIIKKNRGRL